MSPPSRAAARVLVVDDDSIIVDSLSELLRVEGYDVRTASSLDTAVRSLESDDIDVVLADVSMPGGNGFELLHVIRKRFSDAAVIMITGYGTIESAVEAIKLGAFDYLTKPINDDELLLCLQRAVAQQAIVRENRDLRQQLDERFGLESIIGHDYRMLKLFDMVESIAPSPVTVLLHGASGTGKSLLARVIHQLSERRDKPFIEVSCGALPETLLESELFGHARGAFTGAVANKIGKFKAAHGGTLFLDEIASASPTMQVKLLRVLQSQQFEPVGSNRTETVDVRVVLASNVLLEDEVRAGRFREDLYYRVNVVCLELPSLAERVGDIPLLAEFFLRRAAGEMRRECLGFDKQAMSLMQRHAWPGNVRELVNVVTRAVVLSKGPYVTVDDLPAALVDGAETAESVTPLTPMPLRQALELPERRILEAALKANGWNRQLTAEQLGINRTTLYKKMKRYGLDERSVGIR
ncbi:MAG: sigma-54-dependent Fis family transcriptional regulator [Phycisphaerae bacterium]|nr:sigma-54-dependent Fis family transcriptional regulator [Phycisphaerae bacterium]